MQIISWTYPDKKISAQQKNQTQKVDNSIEIEIKEFITQHCKVAVIEHTTNTQELKKIMLVTNDTNY